MVYLACKVTYKNGLVGVHSEIFKTGLAKELGIKPIATILSYEFRSDPIMNTFLCCVRD